MGDWEGDGIDLSELEGVIGDEPEDEEDMDTERVRPLGGIRIGSVRFWQFLSVKVILDGRGGNEDRMDQGPLYMWWGSAIDHT